MAGVAVQLTGKQFLRNRVANVVCEQVVVNYSYVKQQLLSQFGLVREAVGIVTGLVRQTKTNEIKGD